VSEKFAKEEIKKIISKGKTFSGAKAFYPELEEDLKSWFIKQREKSIRAIKEEALGVFDQEKKKHSEEKTLQ